MNMASLLSYPELVLSLASFLFFLLLRRIKRTDGLPTYWPVIGMLPDLIAHRNRIHDWATDILLASDTGYTFLFRGPWFSSMDMLVTGDPANVYHVFINNFANYPKGHEFSEIAGEFFGDGIFNSDGESWKFQRKKSHSLMSDRKFRAFVNKCSHRKVTEGLVPLLRRVSEQGVPVDLQDVFLRYAFDVTCCIMVGADPRSLSPGFPTNPVGKAFDDAMTLIFFRHTVPQFWWKLLRHFNFASQRKLAEARVTLDNFIAENIAKRKRHIEEEEAANSSADLLSSYIGDEDFSEMDSDKFNKFVRDTMLNLMLASRDTTSSALTWFFWLLSNNQRVEEKILKELKEKLPVNSELGEAGELRELVYLHAALCEALRLYPPVAFQHKGAVEPDVLPSGHKAIPGTKIILPLYSMGRLEEIWGKDCLEFKPERWISERGRLRDEPSYKFFSFNAGPRSCLGKNMAFDQMKALAAAMIINFRVEVVEGHVVEPKLSIILHMKHGLMVKIKKRELH